MAYAVKGELNISSKFLFEVEVNIGEGSLYIIAIETNEVILIANENLNKIEKFLKNSEKPKIEGDYWEEFINIDHENHTNSTQALNIDGQFAFELNDFDGLNGYDVDSGEVKNVVIAWAVDGDSPKIYANATEISNASLINVEELDDFESL